MHSASAVEISTDWLESISDNKPCLRLMREKESCAFNAIMALQCTLLVAGNDKVMQSVLVLTFRCRPRSLASTEYILCSMAGESKALSFPTNDLCLIAML